MISNKKVTNYKDVDHSEIYNFVFDYFSSKVVVQFKKIEF